MKPDEADSTSAFFALLKAGMYGTPIPEAGLPAEIDWNGVVRLAKKHAVLGTVIEGIQFLPEHLRPAEPMAAKMRKFALGLFRANVVMEKRVATLSGFLSGHGIDGVLLKGQGVARYYRTPQSRQSGDIDFYVGQRRYKRAKELCREQFVREGTHWHETEQHFDFELDGATIELHRIATRMFSPLANRRFQRWLTEQLESSPERRRLTFGSTDILIPSADFDAIYIFYHAWRHFISGGIGLRQLCDWTMIFHTHGDRIDRPRLEANIRRFGMTAGWKLFAGIAVRHLGLEPGKMPLYDPAYDRRSERVMATVMDGGNFGFHNDLMKKTMSRSHLFTMGLGKVHIICRDFISIFPVVPAEATFLYFDRMYYGTLSYAKKFMHKILRK